MSKKGFTLIELLGVIIILGLLIVIALPRIINSVKNMTNKTDDVMIEMVYDAAKLYVGNNSSDFKKNIKYSYCIQLDELIEEDLLKEPIKLSDIDVTHTKSVQVTYKNGYKYELKDNENCIERPITLVKHITNLYKPNSTVVNNDITYNIDTTNKIIDDGFGGTISSGGNLRYYGANPNNYIDIGDRDSSGNIILWRIIGVFETKYATDSLPCDTDSDSDGYYDNCASDRLVKIIRDESIGDYSWDYRTNEEYDNRWDHSTLGKMLNESYYNSNTTIYYNNSPTSITVDFKSEGLSQLAQSKVENALWNFGALSVDLGEKSYMNSFSDEYYKYEREPNERSIRPIEWVGNIGLMYTSDYGYATDFSLCNITLFNYNSSTNSYACRSNDWLFKLDKQWSITPSLYDKDFVFYIELEGGISVAYPDVSTAIFSVRPVLYLKSDVMMTGEGTTSDGINYYIVE